MIRTQFVMGNLYSIHSWNEELQYLIAYGMCIKKSGHIVRKSKRVLDQKKSALITFHNSKIVQKMHRP